MGYISEPITAKRMLFVIIVSEFMRNQDADRGFGYNCHV